jgi:hypothetical protein
VHGVRKKANWEFKNYPGRKPMNNNPMESAITMLSVFDALIAAVYFVNLT